MPQSTIYCNTVSAQLKAIIDANAPLSALWKAKYNADVVVAIDNAHMWDIAANMVDRPRAILSFADQTMRGDEGVADVMLRVYNEYECMITRQRGYTNYPGDALIGQAGTPSGGNPAQGSDYGSFYDLVEAGRDAIITTTITNDPTIEMPIYARGIQRVPYDSSLKIYGYIVKFAIGTQLTPGTVTGTS